MKADSLTRDLTDVLLRERDREGTQICRRCGRTKLLWEFFLHRQRGGGFRRICNGCLKPDEYDRYSLENERAISAFEARWADLPHVST